MLLGMFLKNDVYVISNSYYDIDCTITELNLIIIYLFYKDCKCVASHKIANAKTKAPIGDFYRLTWPMARPCAVRAEPMAIGCVWPFWRAVRRCSLSTASSSITLSSGMRGYRFKCVEIWFQHLSRLVSDKWANNRKRVLKIVWQTGQTPSR